MGRRNPAKEWECPVRHAGSCPPSTTYKCTNHKAALSAALEDGAENLQQRLLMSSACFPDACSNLAATKSGVNVADGPTRVAWNVQGLCETEDGACITGVSEPWPGKSTI
ncbi:hypothetical protein MRX96_019481 [Rhipicephalus microplus]